MRIMKKGNENMLRAQSMLEMLSAYAWAILIISLFILVIITLTTSTTSQAQFSSECTIGPLLPCGDVVLTNYSAKSGIVFYISFTNDFKNPILFPTSNAINLSTTGVGVPGSKLNYGTCAPYLALSGSPVLCTISVTGSLSPPVGTTVNLLFTLSYYLCQSNSQSSCSATLYKSTGYGSVSVAPATINTYTVSFMSKEVNGITGTAVGSNAIIYMNGVPYASGQNAMLITPGNYNLYAALPSSFAFNSWASSAPASPVLPANSLLAVLTLNSAGGGTTVTEKSTNLACYVCYQTSVSSLVCPSTCTKTSGTIIYPNGQGSYTCGSGWEACT